jgi:O-antigen/teichoic acid export membrane protein
MAISLVLLLAGFSKELLWVFTTTQYYGSWHTIPLLAAAMLLANMYIFAPGIFIARRTGLVAAINVGAALLNVGGNFLLIPVFGTLGAASATLASSLIAFLMYVYCNRRFYPIPFDWHRIIAAGALGLVIAVALAGLQTIDGITALLARAGLCLTGAAAAALILLGTAELRLLMEKARRRTGF